MQGLAAHSAKAAKRKRASRLLIPASFGAAILIVAALYSWDRFAKPANQPPSVPPPSSAQKLSPIAGNSVRSKRTRPTADVTASNGAAPQPIGLLLAPAGVRMAVHLRPAELWSTVRPKGSGRSAGGDELTRSLPALASWTERQMAERCLFPPGEIEEVLFSLVLRSPGDPPDVAATVWLKKTETPAKIAARFGGVKRDRAALPTWVKTGGRLSCGTARHSPSRVQQLPVLLGSAVPGQGDLDRHVVKVRQELVQRRVDQPDGDRQAVHGLQDLHEVAALQWLERVEGRLPSGLVLGEDAEIERSWRRSPRGTRSRPDQAHAAATEPARPRAVLAGVGVGVDAEAPPPIRVLAIRN